MKNLTCRQKCQGAVKRTNATQTRDSKPTSYLLVIRLFYCSLICSVVSLILSTVFALDMAVCIHDEGYLQLADRLLLETARRWLIMLILVRIVFCTTECVFYYLIWSSLFITLVSNSIALPIWLIQRRCGGVASRRPLIASGCLISLGWCAALFKLRTTWRTLAPLVLAAIRGWWVRVFCLFYFMTLHILLFLWYVRWWAGAWSLARFWSLCSSAVLVCGFKCLLCALFFSLTDGQPLITATLNSSWARWARALDSGSWGFLTLRRIR